MKSITRVTICTRLSHTCVNTYFMSRRRVSLNSQTFKSYVCHCIFDEQRICAQKMTMQSIMCVTEYVHDSVMCVCHKAPDEVQLITSLYDLCNENSLCVYVR